MQSGVGYYAMGVARNEGYPLSGCVEVIRGYVGFRVSQNEGSILRVPRRRTVLWVHIDVTLCKEATISRNSLTKALNVC